LRAKAVTAVLNALRPLREIADVLLDLRRLADFA
jgi:hypothetical protein